MQGFVVYSDSVADAGNQVREIAEAHPRAPRVVFFRRDPGEPIEGASRVRVRAKRRRGPDVAACRVEFPAVRHWRVWREEGKATPVPRPRDRDDGRSVDVLAVLGRLASWVEYRGERMGRFLDEHGIRHGWTRAEEEADLAREIEDRAPKVVLNETWTIRPDLMERLARRFPGIRFVALTHGTIPFMATQWSERHYEFLRLARERANCWYGHVMGEDDCPAPSGTKVIALPNLVEVPERLGDPASAGPDPPSRTNPLVVSMIARDVLLKHWGAAVLALPLVARERPVQVVASAPGVGLGIARHVRYLETAGVPVTQIPWSGWGNYLDRVARVVHVGLCPSLAESFGLVPLEHCLLGRPVAGSPALGWLPPGWQASPQSPAAVADLILEHAAKWAHRGDYARKLARQLADENHRRLLENLRGLLE